MSLFLHVDICKRCEPKLQWADNEAATAPGRPASVGLIATQFDAPQMGTTETQNCLYTQQRIRLCFYLAFMFLISNV
jgi:hypothetical protein